jgi:NO-binding membrane sensor protein with MHYT domain
LPAVRESGHGHFECAIAVSFSIDVCSSTGACVSIADIKQLEHSRLLQLIVVMLVGTVSLHFSEFAGPGGTVDYVEFVPQLLEMLVSAFAPHN